MICKKIAELTQTCHTQPSEPGWCSVPRFPAIHLSRQSPFYGLPGHISSRDGIDLCPSSVANPSRHRHKAHRLARWFAGRTPTCHRTATHGRQSPVGALSHAFLQFIWRGNRHSTGLQGISARAMAPVCVHRASRTPPDIAPRHIGSRDGLQEDRRPDTELPHTALRTRLVPCPTLSCNSSVTAIAILRAYRAYPLARWHRFVSIERREPLQTSLQGTSARAMISRKNPDLPQNCHTRPSGPG